jgi:hypothetical protein
MKILILTTLALDFLLLNAASCSKDNSNTLSPETQEGKNTLVVYVNGIVLLNKGQPYIDSPNLGALIYSLISDGQLIDTKKMILTD